MIKQKAFEEKNRECWRLMQLYLGEKKKSRPREHENFPQMYRRICRQLAIARERNYSPILIQYLEEMATAGHQLLYGKLGGNRMALIRYFWVDFPSLIRREWRLVFFSHLLFYVPFFALLILIQFHPHLSYMVLPDEMISGMEFAYDPANNHFEEQRAAGQDFSALGMYIRNNIGIDFRCFAGGIFFGLGSIFFVFYNGLIIGAVAGHITQVGYGETFWPFVCGHSAPELTAAVFSGAAGMKMGFAFIKPGRKTRMQALKDASKTAMRMLWGTAAMTFFAAFVEAFWSSSAAIPVNTKYTVAACMWTFMILYFVFAGRSYESE